MRTGLLARAAVAFLIAGVGLLNFADADWTHAVGLVCLLGFAVAMFAAVVFRVEADANPQLKEKQMSQAMNGSDEATARMLGALPGSAALGRGPMPEGDYARHEYHHPAAGWGAVRSVANVLEKSGVEIEGTRALFVMNHENGGFDCPGCAWPDDPTGLRLDLCETVSNT